MVFREGLLHSLYVAQCAAASPHNDCFCVVTSAPGKVDDDPVSRRSNGLTRTLVSKNGSERESVTPSDFMRVLDFGNSGYTQEDARNRLEQSTGVAWI